MRQILRATKTKENGLRRLTSFTALFISLSLLFSLTQSLSPMAVARLKATHPWMKMQMAWGVVFDKEIPGRLKSKIFRAVARPEAIYGVRGGPATKETENLSVVETCRLCWMARVVHVYPMIPNEYQWFLKERLDATLIVENFIVCDVTSTSRWRCSGKQRWLCTPHLEVSWEMLQSCNWSGIMAPT